ncbi:MAG: hypothetical protein E4H44_00660 [Candidatus Aminicenantes bacterium]|nr:MAG: hypothetical protein E4H44_00660 [Candidatus Aminicenantes bacterium]
MSIFDWLKNSVTERPAVEESSSTAVRDIAQRLSDLDPDHARWVAAFAMVRARAARADLDISREELREMQKIVHEIGGLPEEQSSLVAEMAAHRNELLGVTEDYLSTREFKQVAGEGDAERLLHCLFAVTAADDTISLVEEEEVRQVANELGVEPARYTAIRSRFREKRSVLRGTIGNRN